MVHPSSSTPLSAPTTLNPWNDKKRVEERVKSPESYKKTDSVAQRSLHALSETQHSSPQPLSARSTQSGCSTTTSARSSSLGTPPPEKHYMRRIEEERLGGF